MKPAVKLTSEKRCSLIPCKIAAVTVNKANNKATGAYQASKRPDISSCSIPNKAPYASYDNADRPTTVGIPIYHTICIVLFISFSYLWTSFFLIDSVNAVIIVKDNLDANYTGMVLNL